MDRILSGSEEGKAEGSYGRHENAKYKLADSVKKCMKTTPVDRITVKDIAEGCGLTRQTFYRNFKDKYDLINWYFDKLVQQSLGQIETGSRVRESLARKLAFIQEEKAFFCGAFRSDDHNSLKEHDFELILQFYDHLLARRISKPLDDELQFQLKMYCRGSVYMTVKWVLGGNERFTAADVRQIGGCHAAKAGQGI